MRILTQLAERFRGERAKEHAVYIFMWAVILIIGKIIEDIPVAVRAIRFYLEVQ